MDGVEHIPAHPIGNNEWQLIRSPLYATEVASGDTARILDEKTGSFEIINRNGNVCIQFYLDSTDADDKEATISIAKTITEKISCIGGTMDTITPGLIAFTVHLDVGFPAIEEIFQEALNCYPASEWQYTNVYDSQTGAPPNWWSQSVTTRSCSEKPQP